MQVKNNQNAKRNGTTSTVRTSSAESGPGLQRLVELCGAWVGGEEKTKPLAKDAIPAFPGPDGAFYCL